MAPKRNNPGPQQVKYSSELYILSLNSEKITKFRENYQTQRKYPQDDQAAERQEAFRSRHLIGGKESTEPDCHDKGDRKANNLYTNLTNSMNRAARIGFSKIEISGSASCVERRTHSIAMPRGVLNWLAAIPHADVSPRSTRARPAPQMPTTVHPTLIQPQLDAYSSDR